MKRGHILSNDNNYYMLVRIESGVSAIDPNGQKTDLTYDRYNLVNLDTGKTRVSDPARMYVWPSHSDNINIDSLRSHFNMPNLQDTGVTCDDMNFGSIVAQAVHDKRLRCLFDAPAPTTSADATLNACIAALRQMGLVG